MYLYRSSTHNNFKGHDIFRFVSVSEYSFLFIRHGVTTRSGGRIVTLAVGYTMPSTGDFAVGYTFAH